MNEREKSGKNNWMKGKCEKWEKKRNGMRKNTRNDKKEEKSGKSKWMRRKWKRKRNERKKNNMRKIKRRN